MVHSLLDTIIYAMYSTSIESNLAARPNLKPIHNLKRNPPALPIPIPIPDDLKHARTRPPRRIPLPTTIRHLRIVLRLRHLGHENRRIDEIRIRSAKRRFPHGRRKHGEVFLHAAVVVCGCGGAEAEAETDGDVHEDGADLVAGCELVQGAQEGC